MTSLLVALLVGALQGIFEWLPISSEGNVTLVLTALGYAPEAAVGFSLYLHLGTAASATAYYRTELADLATRALRWRPSRRWDGDAAEVTFLGLATLVSVAVAGAAYAALLDLASAVAGGTFVAAIGVLLVATGLLQRVAGSVSLGDRPTPGAVDALIVGAGQGLAVLPGVSRSGTTVSALLLRGHDGEASFRLSFLLSIPAAVGGGVLAFLDGAVVLDPAVAAVALATSAVVGYLSIDALLRVVRRVAFWAVCVGLGVLAVVGGALVLSGGV
jgi:undecaprenyl-diphosphatase